MSSNSDSLEARVLSSLCRLPEIRRQYLAQVEVDDFFYKQYREIYEVLLVLVQNGSAVTQDSVTNMLADPVMRMTAVFLFEKGDPITREEFLLFKKGGVKNRQIRLRDYLNRSLQTGLDPEIISEEVRKRVASMESNVSSIEVVTANDAVDATHLTLDQWAKGEQPVVSGLPELDDKLFLSQFVGYWVIAGQSGGGKSALMCNIAKHNAMRGVPVTLCSLEMNKEQLLVRMAMDDPKVRGLELTERTVRNNQRMSDLKYALDRLRKLPMYIINGVYDIFHLEAISRKNAENYGCRLTMFDYIQLGKSKPTDTDVVRVYTVSRVLQSLSQPDKARGYSGQVVIALSQYSNEATKENRFIDRTDPDARRKAKRPTNADLAWSGQIKQDADGILHLYQVSDERDGTIDVEIFCGKQRMYRAGWTVPTELILPEQRFATKLSNQRRLGFDSLERELERPINF